MNNYAQKSRRNPIGSRHYCSGVSADDCENQCLWRQVPEFGRERTKQEMAINAASRQLHLLLVLIASPVCCTGGSIDKESLLSKYRDKFVVVMDDGISIGICQAHPPERAFGWAPPEVIIVIAGLQSVQTKSPLLGAPGCGPITAEPVHKEEVLKVNHAAFHGAYLQLNVANVSPHSVARGVGAFGHASLETGAAFIRIRAGNDGKDLDAADALAAHWFKPVDTAADAATLGNTASGAFVSQVKAGMSFAEVEHALGVPQTRVDLGEKVLYRYKDMTVEFHDGKVTDVR